MSKYLLYGLILQSVLTSILIASSPSSAQSGKKLDEINISISIKQQSLKQVLKKVEKISGFTFTYNDSNIDEKVKLSLDVDNESMYDLLTRISLATKVSFKRIGKNIFVKQNKMPVKTKVSEVLPKQIVVSGKVISSEDNEVLPGVSIIIKGKAIGTTTDIDGNYDLQAVEGDVLQFSYIGFRTQEITVGKQSTINVTLQVDLEQLEEVVVVGYGTQERAEVTGAITTVKSDELRQLPVADVNQALQGRAAGVYVSNNGSPGRGATIRIRGIGTVNNNGPLYVIDGVPAGGLNSINPADIESVEILKDASASAIYGSRAANGVILITTKKGKAGKARVSLDSYYGTQSVWNTYDLLNTSQYIDYATELQQNAGLPVPNRLTDSQWEGLRNQNIDWQDELFQTAAIQDHNFNISGGNESSTYSISGGYFRQDGTVIGTDFERYSFRANTNFDLGKLKIGQTLTVAYSKRNNEANGGTNRSMLEHAIKAPPYLPILYEDYLSITGDEQPNIGGFKAPDQSDNNDAENPIAIQRQRTSRNENMKLLGSLFAEYEIIKDLKFKSLFGIDMAFDFSNNYTPSYYNGEFHNVSFAAINQNRFDFISPLFTNSLNYEKSIGEHSFSALAALEYQSFSSRNLQGSGENAITNNIRVLNGTSNPNVGGRLTEWALISYIGRVNYNFADKYLLTASIRRDGSARFGPNNKWGVFPSFSVGWRLNEEAFLQDVTAISDLKLRASWGRTGNQEIGDYGYQATINGNFNYNFNNNLQSASTVRDLANSDLQWETTEMTNFGIDLGLFDNRVTVSAEYFNNETKDMLLRRPLQFSAGLDGSPIVNAGSVRNRGLEFNIGYRKATGDFQWSVDANFSTVQNEVLSLINDDTPINGSNYEGDQISISRVGEPIFFFYGWQVDRLFQQSDFDSDGNLVEGIPAHQSPSPGDVMFRDIAGPLDENGNPTGPDGIIDANDRVKLGHAFPDLIYGINATANYKNFDLTVFLQGVTGNEIYNTIIYDLQGMTRVFNAGTEVLDRWTPTNTNTSIPRAVSGDPNDNARASDRYIEDGSYLRLKNIALGYSFPQNAIDNFSKGSISNIRIYVAAQNLITITDYSGYDPEIGTRQGLGTSGLGIDFGQYPQARTFLGGIQISF